MSEAVVVDADVVVRAPDALAEFGTQGGIARALEIANQLDSIIREKRLWVSIKGRDHLKVEAWCALASMVGVSPRTRDVREVRNPQSGELDGYEAYVEAVRGGDGAVIGGAQAGCFFDETIETKDGREIKRWKERHAVQSMAQTRATSKALGQILRFIPVLAGYSGTPAEEMPREPAEPKERAPRANLPASDEQISALRALSYERAAELGYATDHKIAASIRKAAMAHLNVESKKIPEIAVEALKRAILDAIVEKGHGVIPEVAGSEAFNA